MSETITFLRGMFVEHKKKIKFLSAGAFNTFFGISFYIALTLSGDFLRKHYILTLVISQIVSTLVAYVVYKAFVFETKGNYLKELIKFFSIYYVNYAINLAVLPLCVELLGIQPIYVQIVFTIAMVIASFILHSRFTFAR